ncbi:MAG: signal peptidase I [Lactobacillales bacterium]|jgi:signal peptidase I|nr:signal peptidase I [Lactobacillales bacterium]
MTFKKIVKEWGPIVLTALVIFALRLFVFTPIRVEGHSMDPTLQDGERMYAVKTAHIDRLDIVVVNKIDEQTGEKKAIIKRVIGLPGDTLKFHNDQLTINGTKYSEPYLDDYKEKFVKDHLQSTYSYDKNFQLRAASSLAFTVDNNGNPDFSVTIPDNHYFIMGDDRPVSGDSREIGCVPTDWILGEAKLSYWPIDKIKLVK